MSALEVNFDGLPGPTHNFAGLAYGNLASAGSAGERSWPRSAALQSIAKMRTLKSLGLVQGILPPHPRPALDLLRDSGFDGNPDTLITTSAKSEPALLAAAYSSSPMWVANAATVTPSFDSGDGRIHFTPANLSSQLHRSIESSFTARLLKAIFNNEKTFCHHPPLPCAMPDEGAANHTRLSSDYAAPGVALFVYGRRLFDNGISNKDATALPRLPARQSLEASRAVARAHRLDPQKTVFAQQSPQAIDAGVFHNDVISVGNRNLFLAHQNAFVDQHNVYAALEKAFKGELKILEVPAQQIPVERAVSSYLFNSQLVSPESGDRQVMIAPGECRDDPDVYGWLKTQQESGIIDDLVFLDVRQSMKNGGGPACLRLRVVLSPAQLNSIQSTVIATEKQLDSLEDWIEANYPEYVDPADLADPSLMRNADVALRGVYRILGLEGLIDDEDHVQIANSH
ncbi:MAG: N-succinylarginine dihydrolase [marine bacterium B5-7]|nr:MAG: N-succinylarginine dihydrolase [marine bacterium B5-7]